MNSRRVPISSVALCLIAFSSVAAAENIDQCNVVWDSPSANARGSMPIGNGDIGLNVWVEPSGDLLVFVGKTDAWDENSRLLKLGKVRVRFTPPLTTTGFRQELKLNDGVIEIQDRQTKISVWVDANHPVIQVDAKSLTGQPLEARASFETWRKEKRSLGGPHGGGGNEYFATGYTSLPAFSYPDTILPAAPNRIGWYHRNLVSPWLPSLKLQKNDAIAKTETDPILNRTMGAILKGENFIPASDTELKPAKPANELSLRIHVLTQITDTPEQWLASLEKQAAAVDNIPAAERRQEHGRWWHDFWNRSWIFADGNHSLDLPINAQPWRIGKASNGGSRFGGGITGPRVIGRALSASEVANLAGKEPASERKLEEEGLTTGCTVVAWVKPAAGEAGRILDKCTAGKPDGILFDAHPGLSLRWIVGDQTMVQPGCLVAGKWQHVAATADTDTGTRRIYLNGKLVKEERGDPAADTLTRGYTLQRWINACGGRGAFPIKFNGSIFVVDNRFDADYRAWGGGYWFQNTRLPYWSMLTSGDFDLMQPFFKMYMKALPARKLATKNYYGHDGAFFPETMSFWGNYLDQGDLGYGVARAGKPDGLTDNQFIRRYWQGGIEMVALMLDYYDLTEDAKFRDTTLIPFAAEIVTFFDQHWTRGTDGKILFHPSQSLETWWDSTNPLPEIAGLHYVLPRLLRLTSNATLTTSWQKTLSDLPPVPLGSDAKTGKQFLLPAERFASKNNSENPEMYAVFPYRLYTLAGDSRALDIGRNTWLRRHHPEGGGWQQNGIQAALLGLAEEARRYAVHNASSHASDFRFPAMWGPNYDWTPDQDHGSVMVSTFQRMVVQYEGEKIYVLPAWPKDWNVSFKLHAPHSTTIEGVYRHGKLEQLSVTPESRRKDVVILEKPNTQP